MRPVSLPVRLVQGCSHQAISAIHPPIAAAIAPMILAHSDSVAHRRHALVLLVAQLELENFCAATQGVLRAVAIGCHSQPHVALSSISQERCTMHPPATAAQIRQATAFPLIRQATAFPLLSHHCIAGSSSSTTAKANLLESII